MPRAGRPCERTPMARPPERRATFVGIGAQKTASTWLYGVLASFPQVTTSTPKELDFFSAAFDRGYEWYERHFVSPRPARHRTGCGTRQCRGLRTPLPSRSTDSNPSHNPPDSIPSNITRIAIA